MTDRACPYPRCRKVIPSTNLMCRPHWRMVPKSAKAAVRSTYRALRKLDGGLARAPQTGPKRVEAARALLEGIRAHRVACGLAVRGAWKEGLERGE